jgi:Lon protease-like protein
MEQRLLPLFPLQLVLFPRTALPLHIFEDRYKEMMGEIIPEKGEFGVVMASEKGICSTGCTATVEKVLETYEDGRMDLIAIGRRRFEIQSLDDQKSYLRGTVDFFDDEEFDPIPADIRARALEGYKALREAGEDAMEPEMADPQLSFQLAQIVPDLTFRQLLLNTRSESDRMKQLAGFLPGFTSRQRQIQHIKTVAPKNGHGKWPPSA